MAAKPDLLQVAQIPPFLMERLQQEFTIHDFVNPADPDALLERIGSRIRGIIAGGTKGPNANLINALPNLEIISSFSVGYDATDVVAAQSRGVIVTHTPEVLTGDVADLAMTFILMITRRIGESERFLRQGKWLQGRMDLGTTVKGKRLGILGLGRIGKAVARRAEAFGLHIQYHDIKPLGDLAYRSYPTLLDLARMSDILLVTCEGGEANRGLVNAEVLDALGPEGFLVNTARGPIIDQPAMVKALQEGRIAGAALDVFDGEPEVPAALMAMENVVLTPHIASSTHETRRAMGDLVYDNLKAHFSGKPVLTPVPPQV
ncbi:MAG: 2-hydroxyacid dehydrogenase [Alphaproteobacteria bacterium]|nr:2-hydroxyacid dehydrogenase [Alphaproteobacteria bacterium]MCB9929560.1 2-hydroxyacid dehydrogenase [Alphaproteobacteria bacterium]